MHLSIAMHAQCFYNRLTDPPLECSHARTRFAQISQHSPNLDCVCEDCLLMVFTTWHSVFLPLKSVLLHCCAASSWCLPSVFLCLPKQVYTPDMFATPDIYICSYI